jgi:hypothetical protein
LNSDRVQRRRDEATKRSQELFRAQETGPERRVREAKRKERAKQAETRQQEKRDGKRKWAKDDLLEDFDNDRKRDERPKCKERPKNNRGSGGSRDFIPWCRDKHR